MVNPKYDDQLKELQDKVAHLEQELQKRSFELQVLSDLSRNLDYSLTYAQMSRKIIEHLHQIIPYDVAAMIVNDEFALYPQRPVEESVQEDIVSRMRGVLDDLQGDRVSILTYAPINPPVFPDDTSIKAMGSVIQVPITIENEAQVVGILLVATELENRFDEKHVQLLYAVANQAATTVSRLQWILEGEQGRLENLITVLPTGVVAIDSTHTLSLLNLVGQKLLNMLSPGVSLGNTLTHIGSRTLASILRDYETKAQDKHYKFTLEENGFVIEVTVRIKEAGKHAGGWIFVLRDITESVRTQETLRLNEKTLKVMVNRLMLLHKIDGLILSTDSIDELVSVALKGLLTLVPAKRCTLFQFDETTRSGKLIKLYIREDENSDQYKPVIPSQASMDHENPIDQEIIQTFESKKYHLIQDVTDYPAEQWRNLEQEGIQSVLSVALTYQDKIIGGLFIHAQEKEFFTSDYIDIAIEIADQLAIGISNLRQDEEIRQHTVVLENRVRKRTIALQNAKEQVEAILNNSPDSILLLDKDLKIQRANNQFHAMFGCTDDYCSGKSILMLAHEDSQESIRDFIHTEDALQSNKRLEFQAVDVHGAVFDAELSLGIIEENGFVCVIRNITVRKTQERQLRYYASFQQNISDAVIATDNEFHIQSWNRAAEHVYGWKAEEVIGKTVRDVLHTQHAPGTSRRLAQKALENDKEWRDEVRQKHKDGRWLDISSSVSQLTDENGVVIGVIAVNRDISQRKAIERQLLFNASVQENMSDAVIVTDLELGVQSWNKAAEIMYGWTAEEVIGKNFREILHSLDTPEEMRQQALNVLFEQGFVQGESVRKRKTNEAIHVSGSVTLLKDDHEQPIGIVEVTRDFTERKKAEEALKKSSEQIHDLYNSAPCGYHSLDKQGIFVQINDTELEWLGYTREEVIGKLKFSDLCTAESILIFQQNFPRFKEVGKVSDLEFELIRKDGSIMHILLNATAVYDDNNQYLMSRSTLFDISDLKRAQQSIFKSEERLRTIVDNIPIMISFFDAEGNFEFVNRHWLDQVGWTLEDLTEAEDPLALFYPDPEYRRQVLEFMLSAEEGWRDFNCQTKYRGERITSWTNVSLSDGRSIGIGQDITERKHTENALAEERNLLHTLIDAVPDYIYVKDKEHRFILSNFAHAKARGADKAEDLIGKTDHDFFPQELADRFRSDETPILQSGKPLLDHEQISRGFEGGFAWALTNKVPLRNVQGKIIGLVGITRDITDRKQAMDALQESEERFRRAIIDAPFPIMIHAEDGEVLNISRIWTEITGYSLDEIPTIPDWTEKAYGVRRENVKQIIDAVYSRTKAYKGGEFHVRTKSGDIRIWDFIAAPLGTLPDGRRMVSSMAMDVTERKQAENALHESESRYRALFEQSTDGVFILDLEGNHLFSNQHAAEMLGYTVDEMKNLSSFRDVSVPDEYADGERVLERLLNGEKIPIYERRVRRKDGTIFPVEINIELIRDADDQPLHIQSMMRDITERKRSAAELERQRVFLRAVIDTSPSMIFVKDIDGRFIFANPAMASMFDTTVEGLLQISDADLNIPDNELERFNEDDRLVINQGETLSVEESITLQSGEVRWLQTTKVPLISEDGETVHILGISIDITDRKQSEIALRASEEKHRHLIETMSGGLTIADYDSRFTYVNDRFCEIIGYERDEIIGRTSEDFVAEEHRSTLMQHIQQRRQGQNSSYETVVMHKNNTPVHLLVSGSALKDRIGNVTGSYSIVMDITARKQAEIALEQALAKEKELGELKTRFVSMASHEFRTPLASILAIVETLSAYRHKLSEEKIDQRFDRIKNQISHLQSIMEDVLLLARMQARKVQFNPTKLDLDALCRSVLDEFKNREDIKHQIEYQVSPEFPELKLDRKLMHQVINNLISNAIKYSPDGEVVYVNLDYQDSQLILIVRDDGIGIPEHDLKHLFEPFHRAKNVETIPGTGLGLVIIKESIELHGGSIQLESKVGKGTTFTIRIPITEQDK